MEKKLYNNEKNLLIKDLCGRLPYGVKVRHEHLSKIGILYEISMCGDITIDYDTYNHFGNINDTKPYLFPLSSMNEEQKEIYCQLQQKVIYNSEGVVNKDVINYINWCYENHLDINDLIPKGLALDATNLNIY